MRVSAVICAKNEEKTIAEVVKGAKKFCDEVIVVDGASRDRTKILAEKAGAKVIPDEGKGKGEALKKGIREASGEIVVFLDGDGSHDPEEIPRILKPIKQGLADHVAGSRFLGTSDELSGSFERTLRRIGTHIINFLISKRFGIKITDSQNGFRAVKKETLIKLNLQEKITTIEQEMVIKTLKKGYKLVEVPSHEYSRKYGKSKISLLRDGWKYIVSLIYYLYLDP